MIQGAFFSNYWMVVIIRIVMIDEKEEMRVSDVFSCASSILAKIVNNYLIYITFHKQLPNINFFLYNYLT